MERARQIVPIVGMKFFILLFFCLYCSWPLSAQQTDAQEGEEFLLRYESANDQGKYTEAMQWLDQAIACMKKTDNLSQWLLLQTYKGKMMAEAFNQPFEALAYMDNCTTKDLWRSPKDSTEYIELCYFYLDEAHCAKQFAEDYVHSKKALEKAYDIFHRQLKGNDDAIAEYLLFQLGNAYVRLQEYNSAKPIFEEAHQYSFAHNAPQVAKYTDHAGMYVTLEQYEKAKEVFMEGVSRPGLTEEDQIFLQIGLVECLAHLKDLDGAFRMNRNLEARLKKPFKNKETAVKKTEFRYAVQEGYGLLYALKGDTTQALFWYKEAYKTAKNYPKSSSRTQASYQLEIGNLLLGSGKKSEALGYFHAALQTILPTFEGALHENPAVASLTAEKVLLRALHHKALAFRALNQLDKALECFELIPLVEAKLRATHAYESSSLLALKESRQRFQEAVDIAWLLYERSNGNPQYAQRAFRLTELSRGMLLLQSLVQARQYLPEDIRNKDYELRVRMAWLEHEIAAAKETASTTGAQKVDEWERLLFDLKLERQKLLADFPSYNNPDSLFLQVLDAQSVRHLLRPDQAMVNFFFSELSAYVFSFDASGDFRWRKIDLPEDFRAQTRSFNSFLWSENIAGREQFLQHAWRLDSLLLAPDWARWGKKQGFSLVVVSDDVLTLLPFEVLLNKPPMMAGTWRDQPWLLRDCSIGYAYSATLLKLQQGISDEHAKTRPQPPYAFGGFAPDYTRSAQIRLENTQPMIKKVCGQLGGQEWCAERATEAAFKESAPLCRALLLAMHGSADSTHPERSRLHFGDPGPDSVVNNNVLYASELQIMRLQADLVVLSACLSGAGKLEQGEGVYSLARAFSAAGVPATVMSLWLLHENSAPLLVEAFFAYLQAGKTKDEALRLAKLDFLGKDENFEMAHPFYWAGLAALGDMRALDLPGKPFPYTWALGGFVLLGLGMWAWARRRSA